jgi:hypothetical protein
LKILFLKSLYFQKNSPACRTDAVLLKYWDASVRCTSFEPLLNLQRSTITIGNAWVSRLSLPLGFTGGEEGYHQTACKYQKLKKLEVLWKTTYCRTVYNTYVIIRNVFKTIYDVYISYFRLAF